MRKVWLLLLAVTGLWLAACTGGPMDPDDPMMPDPMDPEMLGNVRLVSANKN